MAYLSHMVDSNDASCKMEPHYPDGGHDRYVFEPDNGLFGVFDGIGGTASPAIASTITAECIQSLTLELEEYDSPDELKELLHDKLYEANEKIKNQSNETGTTATVAVLLEEEDEEFITLVYASIGDSQLYVFQNGEIGQVTEDEGEGALLFNALTGSVNDQIVQIDHIEIDSGSTIMLCTDGITGDIEEELLSNEELADALQYETEEAASLLLKKSRKEDDKTVIVLKV